MLFTIIFYDGVTLNTSDAETAIRACDLMDRVSAVINADTKEVLWGSLPWCMLSEEERQHKTELRERAFARKRESNYKEAYLENKLYANASSIAALMRCEDECIEHGLTDVILTLAKEQCDRRFKLYSRGLITKKELLDVQELKSVIPVKEKIAV